MTDTIFEYIFKIAVVGKSKIGKTYLLRKYVEDKNVFASAPTIGVDFFIKKQKFNDKNVLLQFWDISGKEQFRSIIEILLKGTTAAILVFNRSIPPSFKEIEETWIPAMKRIAPYLFKEDIHPQVFLLNYEKHNLLRERNGNKEKVNVKEITELTNRENIEYVEISENSKTTFNEIVSRLIRNVVKNKEKKKRKLRVAYGEIPFHWWL